MLVIGLTGGIGSGKTTVAELFQRQGIEVIDADLISREVVEPGEPALQAIVSHFGQQILSDEGRLRRSALRQLVFSDPEQRKWLERLLHPLINERIRQRITTSRSPYCILMSPLLLETRQKTLVARILIVDVSRETQLQRTMRRDESPRETIEAIMAAQVPREVRIAAADDIIDNNGEAGELAEQVGALHSRYLSLAATGRDSEATT